MSDARGTNYQLVRFGLVTRRVEHLIGFYEAAFGARRVRSYRLDAPQAHTLLGVRENSLCETISVGKELIDFFQFDHPGRPYPLPASAADLLFQHFAIVVSDMGAAFERLRHVPGWTAISRGGPQRLPQSSGGVTAFKFRDPDGHPLELLEFPVGKTPPKWQHPKGIFLGIDHSAITIRNTSESVEFYKQLGFGVSSRSLNRGWEQELLDNVRAPGVEVVALSADTGPHIELLCYHGAEQQEASTSSGADVASTRLMLAPFQTLSSSDTKARAFLDPDGHHLTIASDAFANR